MFRTAPVLLSLALVAGCAERDASQYSPSLSQVRYGRVAPEELSEPVVLPEAQFIPGITTNVEEQDGYDPIPLLLTADQINNLADLDDPAALANHSTYVAAVVPGDLYDEAEGRIEFDDVEQGAIGDCYFVAALSAVLYADEDGRAREGFIRPVLDADGNPSHYVVRFYDYAGRPQDIEVDAQIYRRTASSNPAYARSMDSSRNNEEWAISLIEKAYAQWHGGYEEIGDGGSPGDVMQALTGSHSSYRRVSYLSDASVIKTIADAVETHRPVAALTFGEDDGVDYSGTGVYAWHAYTVLGVDNVDGVDRVQLRNPWGSSEPAGNGEDDGIFHLPLEDFRRLYVGLSVGGGLRADTTAPASVDDLEVMRTGDGSVVLGFTATGDDGTRGLAYSYDIRMSTSPITDGNFYDAEQVAAPSPQSPGERDAVEVTGQANGVELYFALRVADESGNLSGVSNVVSGTPVSEVTIDPNALVFDFESDHDQVLPDGLFHASTTHTVDGGTAMWCGNESSGNYDVGQAEGALLIDSVELTAWASPLLRWDQRLHTEQTSRYDYAYLEVQGNDGEWVRVWERSEANSGVAETIEVDLSDFANETVTLLFQFDSNGAEANDYEGWILDNITFTTAQ